MSRIILTFETTHAVMAAERALKEAASKGFKFRPTPTPSGLSDSICGMSLEILSAQQKDEIVEHLKSRGRSPKGVHVI